MKTIAFIVLACLSTLATGCGEEPARLEVAPNILFVDPGAPGLTGQVEIVRQVKDRVEGNLLRVRTQFRSRAKGGLWIDIQVAWKDKDGFELYKTNWAPKHVPAGVIEDHEIVCMRDDVADYEFRIRKPVRAKD